MPKTIIPTNKSKLMKAGMYATIPAGFILGSNPVTGLLGVPLLKSAEYFVKEYINAQIVGAVDLSPEEALEKFDFATDEARFFDTQPEIAIALAIRASHGDKVLRESLLKEVNQIYYEGKGVRHPERKRITLNDDVSKVEALFLGAGLKKDDVVENIEKKTSMNMK